MSMPDYLGGGGTEEALPARGRPRAARRPGANEDQTPAPVGDALSAAPLPRRRPLQAGGVAKGAGGERRADLGSYYDKAIGVLAMALQ
jgi:hypothetical protein